MKPWTPEAAHALMALPAWDHAPTFLLLQLATEEVARRAGHTEVTATDLQHALHEVAGHSARRN